MASSPSRLACLPVALLLLQGCAHPARPAGATAWAFPASYQATQIVTVALPEGPRDFLASVSRAGARLEVVLFEPSLQIPLLSASGGDGPASETVYLEGIPPGQGRRLVELLASMHATDFEAGDGGDAASGRRGGFRFLLEGLDPSSPCRFPRLVVVRPPAGAPEIRVQTIDVACHAGAPGSAR
jgi:hypothetical protein